VHKKKWDSVFAISQKIAGVSKKLF
jgi:hypothetical protein